MLLLANLLFTVVVPGTVAVYVPVFVFSHAPAVMSATSAAAVALVLIGALMYSWCLWNFASIGRGTPAPINPPRHLVVRGLYRYSRNPMYVGVLTVIFGWALLFRSFSLGLYGMAVAACFHAFVVLYEEPHLKRAFGPSYEEYCASVGRWLSIRKLSPG
jgi:protein-S-isoprenylcysteine O-methyltransferase Ste14